MGKSSFAQTDFTGCEVSPFVQARIDLDGYDRSMSLSYNGLALEQGLWVRRPGFSYAHQTNSSGASASRLIPFEASVDAAYVLEFGNSFYRVFQSPANGYSFNAVAGGVLSFSSITETAATKFVTSGAHGVSTGDKLFFKGAFTTGIVKDADREVMRVLAKFLGRELTATTVNSTTLTVPVDSSYLTTATTGPYFLSTSYFQAVKMVTGTTSYSSAQVTDLRTVQSVDVMYICSISHVPHTLSRVTTAPTFTLESMTLSDGPYLDTNTTATTLTPADSTGTFTITASSTTGINAGQGFLTTDVGRSIRLKDSAGNWTWGTVATRSSTTKITLTLNGANLADLTAITSWRLGLYSDTTGYPKVAVFFDDRLWFSGCPAAPNRVDGSYVGAYDIFKPTDADGTVNDAHAVAAQLLSRENNQVLWMTADDYGLLLGTAHDVWAVQPAQPGANISATNINASRVVKRVGSANADVVETPAGLVFIGRSKRKIYLLKERGGKYETEDLAVAAHHLTAGGIEEIVFQADPIPVVWMRRNDGVLVGLTLQGDAIRGWHWHPIWGPNAAQFQDVYGNGLPSQITSLAVTQRADGLADQVWAVVYRGTTYTMEFMEQFYDEDSATADTYFMDAQVRIPVVNQINSAAYQTTMIFPPHLEGQTVHLYAEGTYLGTRNVSNGITVLTDSQESLSITAANNATGGSNPWVINGVYTGETSQLANFRCGYHYTSQGAMLRPEAGASDGGPAIGKQRGISQVSFGFYRSSDVQIGDYDSGQYRYILSSTTALTTGIVHDTFSKNWSYDGRIAWKCTGGKPCNVTSVTGFIEVTDAA